MNDEQKPAAATPAAVEGSPAAESPAIASVESATLAAPPAVESPAPPAPAPPATPQLHSQVGFYFIFFVSGAAALIYELIWARYITLILGHAAYAQALVLALFLGALALGAIICARHVHRLRQPLLGYVAIEIVVALIAIYYHNIFVGAHGWAVNFVIPNLESPLAIEFFKWTLSACLMLPQAILLGATFPLMSAGLSRLTPKTAGRTVSALYCANAWGGGVGVLASGFVLIPAVGLPGAVIVAGFLNAFAAAYVWFMTHAYDIDRPPLQAAPRPPAALPPNNMLSHSDGRETIVLAIAALTGLASLVYEVVWVRMLSLLLGSSDHTFELMLAAFIFGLAIGAGIIRSKADTHSQPFKLLGLIQIGMGVVALWSLFAFPIFYEYLKALLTDIPRNDEGYLTFMMLGLGLSMAMMLPATILAGMALPLLMGALLREKGEEGVGRAYAYNTMGAVAGVFIALHILLPQTGIQIALLIAALLDMAAGVVLLGMLGSAARRSLLGGAGAAALALVAALVFAPIDPRIAAAAVYRSPQAQLKDVVFYEEGKTASIAVSQQQHENGSVRTLHTNGKPAASLFYEDPKSRALRRAHWTNDELTKVMAGVLPLLYKPDSERVMNIGFGSGLTARTILSSKAVLRLDNVEIEAKVVQGAQHLGARVAPVFIDPRNHFVFNDAKSVLAQRRGTYDIIISEPSAPWARGAASLFTQEHYQQAANALVSDGVLVQWLPLDETTPKLAASAVSALATAFADLHFYLANSNNLIIIAGKQESLPSLSNAIFASDEMRQFLARYQMSSTADIRINYLGGKQTLLPYFESYRIPANSDYYPHVANGATKALFQQQLYLLGGVPTLPVPVAELMGEEPYAIDDVSDSPRALLASRSVRARTLYQERLAANGSLQKRLTYISELSCPLAEDEAKTEESSSESSKTATASVESAAGKESAADATDTNENETSQTDEESAASEAAETAEAGNVLVEISDLMTALLPMTDKDKMQAVWDVLATNGCIARLLASNNTIPGIYTQFWQALSLRDTARMTMLSAILLDNQAVNFSSVSGQVVLLGAVAAHYQQEEYQKAVQLALNLPFTAAPAMHYATQIVATAAAQKL